MQRPSHKKRLLCLRKRKVTVTGIHEGKWTIQGALRSPIYMPLDKNKNGTGTGKENTRKSLIIVEKLNKFLLFKHYPVCAYLFIIEQIKYIFFSKVHETFMKMLRSGP